MSKSENIAVYKYLTRPPTKRYKQNISSPEQQTKIKQMFRDRLPKGVKFDFVKYPSVGLPYYGDLKKIANQIRSQIRRPGSTFNIGSDANEFRFQQRKEKLKKFIDQKVSDFEKNEKFFPNEKFTIQKTPIMQEFKRQNGVGVDVTTLDEVIENYDKPEKIRVQPPGTNTASQLTPDQIKFFNNNYKKKSISQMARELSSGDYDADDFKAIRGQLMRRRDTLIRQGTLTLEDFAEARAAAPKRTKEQIKALKESGGTGFQKYKDAQQRLMDLDPENFAKYSSPATLDSELKSLMNFRKVKLATGALPDEFLASFEHFQGITPGHITQDPTALRKTGLVGRKYNWEIMGKQGKASPYQTVKAYLRTARAELKEGDKKAAKESLRKVNTIYDDVQQRLGTVKRNELPRYSLQGDQVVEKNLKGLIKPQTLEKSFDQYFRNIAGYATEKNIQEIRKTQPNVAEALDLYRSGDDKAARQLIKQRIPEITQPNKMGTMSIKPGQAGLFAEAIPGARAAGELISSTVGDFAKGSIGKGLLKTAGIAGVGYGIYDTGVAFKEGRSGPEMAARFVGLDPVYNMIKEYNRLPKEAQAIQKKINAQMSFDAAQADPLAEGMMQRPEVSDEEKLILDTAKQKVREDIQAENQARAEGRMGALNFIKQKIFQATGQPYEMAFANGGRVYFSEGGDPKDLGRRKFLKLGVALASIPFLGKYIKPATKAAPQVVEAVSRTAESVPTYLMDLISKVKMMGSSKIIGKADNPNGFVQYDLGDYTVTDGAEFTRIRKQNQRGEFIDSEVEMEIQRDPETGTIQYEEATALPDEDGKLKDVDFGIEDDIHEIMRKFTYEK